MIPIRRAGKQFVSFAFGSPVLRMAIKFYNFFSEIPPPLISAVRAVIFECILINNFWFLILSSFSSVLRTADFAASNDTNKFQELLLERTKALAAQTEAIKSSASGDGKWTLSDPITLSVHFVYFIIPIWNFVFNQRTSNQSTTFYDLFDFLHCDK